MKFLLMTYESPRALEARGSDGSVRQGSYWAEWKAFGEALGKAGVVESMYGLQPDQEATTVTNKGATQVLDGAYSPAAAQLGGIFVLEVASKEDALNWASRCPAAVDGAVEVRPMLAKG
jgi:hypothetical protein